MSRTTLKPYRVEWRHNLMTGWCRVADLDDQDAAVRQAEDAVDKWKGQARVISQHVIEVRGL